MMSKKNDAIKYGIKDAKIIKRYKSKLMPQTNGCIEFKSAMWDSRDTYRRFGITYYVDGKTLVANVKPHRFAYALTHGFDNLPQSEVFNAKTQIVNHICHNKKCVNPDHLNILTVSENNAIENKKPGK
jgi:hypothetical protein